LAERTLAIFPRTEVWNLYGPTEATANAIAGKITCDKPVGLGRPIANTAVILLDANLEAVPLGITGEVYITGAGLARGYLGRPDLTAEKFIPNPFSNEPGARLYKTGDLARCRPSGDIEFVGRSDNQVKIRGFRIELGEIESTLAEHPSAKGSVVAAQEVGPGERRLVAYVVQSQGPATTAHELRAFLKEKLPEYMVPSAFVFLEAMPLTANGKPDRTALPRSEQSSTELDSGYLAPRTPVEELLADLWATVLKLDKAGRHDNFFDLGGHSLKATQVMSRVNQTFKIDLPLRSLFEAPTVAELAERIEDLRRKGKDVQTRRIVSVSRDKDPPLSFSQQRLWFLDQLEPGSAVYNMPSALRLRGPLDIRALRQSLNEIVRRHEALRTSFPAIDGEPVQQISSSLILDLPVRNLSGLSESESQFKARFLAIEECEKPFDLARGPLLRAKLLRLGDEDHVLLLTMHHIASDGWSMNR
jgi:acyl carrier protein